MRKLGVISAMSEMEDYHKAELAQFKDKSKESALSSLTSSMTLFMFNQWLSESCNSEKEKQVIRNKVFSDWSKQVISASAPVFENINNELNHPKNRWQQIIDGHGLSTEDYSQAFMSALKELREQFFKTEV